MTEPEEIASDVVAVPIASDEGWMEIDGHTFPWQWSSAGLYRRDADQPDERNERT